MRHHQLSFAVLAAVTVTINAKTDYLPLTAVGNVAAVQSIVSNSDTRLYYQQANGAIMIVGVTGPFTSNNSSSGSPSQLVPPGQAMLGTPIAACSIDSGSIEFNEVRAYMLH